MEELTRNGSQNIGDEHIHQSLVEQVVTVFSPAQNRFKLTQHHQAGLGQALLRLIVSAGEHKLLWTTMADVWKQLFSLNQTANMCNRHLQTE